MVKNLLIKVIEKHNPDDFQEALNLFALSQVTIRFTQTHVVNDFYYVDGEKFDRVNYVAVIFFE
jgi:hypothetical protein